MLSIKTNVYFKIKKCGDRDLNAKAIANACSL